MDENNVNNQEGRLYVVGTRGYSAYEVAVLNGYQGTEEEWLNSLVGPQGEVGPQGKSAYQVAVDNGYQGTEEEWSNSFLTSDGYIPRVDIVNDLTSEATNKPLSANQGKALKTLIDENKSDIEETNDNLDILETTLSGNISSEITNRQNADTDLQSQINALASGSPLVATDTTEMTDTTRIYVNTTDGHWYYYDGDSWEDGGVYQATEDPEVVDIRNGIDGETYQTAGDAIRGQISSISNFTRNLNTKSVGRYYAKSSNGVIYSGDDRYFGMIDKIECLPNTDYAVSYKVSIDIKAKIYVKFYDSEGNHLSNSNVEIIAKNNLLGAYVTTPSDAYYMYVNIYYGDGISIDNNSGIQIELGHVFTPYVSPLSANDKQNRLGEITSIDLVEEDGYFNESGGISAADITYQEKHTQKIDLSILTSIQIDLVYETEEHSMWIACALYDENETFIERVILKNDGSYTSNKYGGNLTGIEAKYIAFTYRKYSDGVFKVTATTSISSVTQYLIDTNKKVNEAYDLSSDSLQKSEVALDESILGAFPNRFKSCYDHLFVKDGLNAVIPHESLYHVRLSKSMGFNVIEANIAKTSDGVFVVNHFASGNFGNYFHHVDGVTDISSTAVSSVTWDWIKNNVRYNSTVIKYQTRPSRLEEFLSECRQQNIIPFLATSSIDIINLADKYMGKNNYIAYGANRVICPSGIIYRWLSLTTKQEIIDFCDSMGKPFIYGMANPTAFSDEDLQDIINTLHEKGYWIGTSYQDTNWYKYAYMGFDLNGTQTRINRIENGNICNLDSTFGFDDFSYINATETDGVLTFTSDGTLSPLFTSNTLSFGGIDLEMVFDGSITIPNIGKHSSTSYTSDGTIPLFISVPIVNGNPHLTISVSKDTVVYDVKFKASKF